MKKTLFVISGTFLLIVLILVLILIDIRSQNMELREINAQYEFYLKKEIYGTELATLINKAIDNNKKLDVSRDKDGFYINNNRDSILISVKMLGSNEMFRMEKIFSLGTEQFVTLFNSGIFVSNKVTYHEDTGRIATIEFIQTKE